ncbi:capsule assembly Wzi family protein [bacterium]|nr:capsule assembly Wzi family protein [bacterium]
MPNSVTRIMLAIALIAATPSLFADGVLPVGAPEYRIVYDRFERQEALGDTRFDYQLGPYRFDSTRFHPGPFARFAQLADYRMNLFGFAGGDYSYAKDQNGNGFESFRGGLVGRPTRRLFVFGSFALDEALADDPTYHGKEWRGLAGDVQDAFVHLDAGPFQAIAGRFGSFWGIRNSVVLAENNRLDGLEWRYRWGKVTLSYRLGRLDGLSPQHDGVEEFENRYFAGHRLDIHLSNSVRVGAFETVIFGGPGRQIELFYLNPLIFFHGSQLNEGADDNTSLGFDFTIKPMLGLKLYGQLFVDDFQIEKNTQGDQETDQYGLVIGGYAADVMSATDLRLEYTRVTNWTFNQILERNRYSFNDKPLGAVRGNDYDELALCVIRWLNDDLTVRLNGSFLRQGEGSITAEWTAPWFDVDGDYSEPFPTGVVERTATGSLGLNGFIKDLLFVDIEGGVRFIHNREHIADDDTTQPFARVRLSAFLSTVVDLE